MSSAATASRSLEIISSLISPLSEIHSITDAAKESVSESKEVSSTLFNNLPQPLRALHQSLTIIEKCIDMESDSKTLVKKTCVAFIETCGSEVQKLVSDINSVTATDYLQTEDKILTEIESLNNEMSTVIKLSADTIKARNLLSEASEIKVEEPTQEIKHLRDTQKAVFELKSPLMSLLCIAESADSGKIVDIAKVRNSEVILNDMSASIQDLQTALEQIETLSVKESNTALQKYNTEIIETVMESVVKLRSSFEQLSTEPEGEDKNVLKQAVLSIKENLNKISSQIQVIEKNVGVFDILQSENKLDALQKMAQILIALENNLPRLESMPEVKNHLTMFHKNLTKVLENVIESNESKKYFTLMEICDAVNRINASIKNLDVDNVLPLASLNNTLRIIQDQFITNVFDSELNCALLTNISDTLVGIQECINTAVETSVQIDSEHIQDIAPHIYNETKAKVVIEHIDHAIAAIENVKALESTQELKTNVAPTLENICPILEELKRTVASIKANGVDEEYISDISDASSFVQTFATPLCELNQNIIVLNQQIIENIESIKQNSEIVSTVAEPLHELHTTLEILQQDVISQYGEDIVPYDVSVNMASAVQNLQSCIVMIQEQAGMEAADEMSTLEDISGIKTTAETIASDRLIIPATEEIAVEQTILPFNQELQTTATAQALQLLNEHITVLQNPEIIDALDTLSEVSDYSSLKSFVIGLGELHSGIEEVLHPLLMEGSHEITNLINPSKLIAIAEPMQELQQSLSVLDTSNIPIYENLLEMPTERIHSVIQNVSEFKEHLDKCMLAMFPAMHTADSTVEIANKVGALREVCEHLKDIIETTKAEEQIAVPEEVIALKRTVESLLDATDVSKGIKIDQVKCITEELYEKVGVVQEELIQFTPQAPEKLAQEAKLIQTIDEVQSNIAVLEQYDFVDLSRVSDLTCTSPQMAAEIESDSLMLMEDIVDSAVNVVQDSTQDMPIADQMIVEDFYKTCKSEFTIMRCLISKATSHKKIIRLLQQFSSLQSTINDFKVKKSELNLTDDVNGCLATFLIHAEDYLQNVRTCLEKIVKSQSKLLIEVPLSKFENSALILDAIKETKHNEQISEIVNKFVEILEIAKPSLQFVQTDILEEIRCPKSDAVDDNILPNKIEEFATYVEVVKNNNKDVSAKEILDKISTCISKHNDYKDATGTGKALIILKCLSDCTDIIQEGLLEVKTPKHKLEEGPLKAVLTEMLEPLQALHNQLTNVQEQVLKGVDEDSISVDITTTESLVQTMTEKHKEMMERIETEEAIANEEIALIMEVDKEIHSINDSLRSIEGVQVAQVVKELTKPVEDIEKSMHVILSSEKANVYTEDTLPTEKSKQLIQHIDQYIELIEIVEEISAIIKIDDIKETIDIAKELRESIVATETIAENDETRYKLIEVRHEQNKLAKKLQTALSALQVQVFERAQELAPDLSTEVLQRIAQVAAQLQADLVAVTGIRVAVQAPYESVDESVKTIESVEGHSAATTTELARAAAGSEPTVMEQTGVFDQLLSSEQLVVTTEILAKTIAVTKEITASEEVKPIETEIVTENILPETDQALAIEGKEVVAVEETESLTIKEVPEEDAKLNVSEIDQVQEVRITKPLITESVSAVVIEDLGPELHVVDDKKLPEVGPSQTAEIHEAPKASIEMLVQHIDQLISDDLTEVINELSNVIEIEELKQSIRIAKELRENIIASEVELKAETSDVLKDEVRTLYENLAQKLSEALSALENTSLETVVESTSINKNDLQRVTAITENIRADLVAITSTQGILDQTKDVKPDQITMDIAQVKVPEFDVGQVSFIEKEVLNAPSGIAVEDKPASVEIQQLIPETEVQETKREDNITEVVDTNSKLVEALAITDGEPVEDVKTCGINTVVIEQATLKTVESLGLASTDTLTHTIDQFLSDEITNIVKKLSESSNNLELSQSLILAKELFNNLNTSQATPGDHQAQLIQDLNSSLLTLQLVALESVEQPDPIASKEALYKILDVAESLATKLDPLLSSTHQDTGIENETKLQECELDKTEVLNKEENAEPDTSQISLQQTNVDTKTYINKDTDNPRGSAEHSSEIDTTSTARGEILETLLIESAKTVMIPVVGNVLSEDLPSVLELLTPDVSVVNPESGDIPLGGFIEVSSEETQAMEIKEDTMLNIKTGKTALIQHINEFISDETIDLVSAISELKNSQELKESIELAKLLKESVEIIEGESLENTKVKQVKLAQELQNALMTLHNKALESTEDISSMSKPNALQKVSEVITHLQEDLEKSTDILPEVLQTAEIVEIPDEQNSMKQLEILLQEVTDKINIPTVREVEDTEALRDALDEVQTVIIKLKCDYDGAANDTLNETLEDLECSVRSVQLQINEDSPPELLKDACATLQLLVNNMSETQEVQAAETVSVEVNNENILEKCSSESNETMKLLEEACKVDVKNENLAGIVSNLNILKDTIKTLKLSFGSNAEVLIEKGVEVTQTLDQLEDKVFLLEKELAEVNLSTDIRDHILTAVHSVYGSISNMRGTISSIQKRYMFENYGKPSETLLKSIKNISGILDIEKDDQTCWKSFTKSLRKVLNHFEDIKFYINLDKTARLPSDAAFTKIILEELKSNVCEVLVPKASLLDEEAVKKVNDLIEYVNKCLTDIESKSTLEVKEKIPVFKEISAQILNVTELIKTKMTEKVKQSISGKQNDHELLQQEATSLEKVSQKQELKIVAAEGKSESGVKFDDARTSQETEPREESYQVLETVSQTDVGETSTKKAKVRKTVMIQEVDINEIQQIATELVDEIAIQAILAVQNLEELGTLGREATDTGMRDDEIIQNAEISEIAVEERIVSEEPTLTNVEAGEIATETDLPEYQLERKEEQKIDILNTTQDKQIPAQSSEIEAVVSTSDVKTDMEQEPQTMSKEELSANKTQIDMEGEKETRLSTQVVQEIMEKEQDLAHDIQKEDNKTCSEDIDSEKLMEEVQSPSSSLTSGTGRSKLSASEKEDSNKNKGEIEFSQMETDDQNQTEAARQSVSSSIESKDADTTENFQNQVTIESKIEAVGTDQETESFTEKEQVTREIKDLTEKDQAQLETKQEILHQVDKQQVEKSEERETSTSATGKDSKEKPDIEATHSEKSREDVVSFAENDENPSLKIETKQVELTANETKQDKLEVKPTDLEKIVVQQVDQIEKESAQIMNESEDGEIEQTKRKEKTEAHAEENQIENEETLQAETKQLEMKTDDLVGSKADLKQKDFESEKQLEAEVVQKQAAEIETKPDEDEEGSPKLPQKEKPIEEGKIEDPDSTKAQKVKELVKPKIEKEESEKTDQQQEVVFTKSTNEKMEEKKTKDDDQLLETEKKQRKEETKTREEAEKIEQQEKEEITTLTLRNDESKDTEETVDLEAEKEQRKADSADTKSKEGESKVKLEDKNKEEKENEDAKQITEYEAEKSRIENEKKELERLESDKDVEIKTEKSKLENKMELEQLTAKQAQRDEEDTAKLVKEITHKDEEVKSRFEVDKKEEDERKTKQDAKKIKDDEGEYSKHEADKKRKEKEEADLDAKMKLKDETNEKPISEKKQTEQKQGDKKGSKEDEEKVKAEENKREEDSAKLVEKTNKEKSAYLEAETQQKEEKRKAKTDAQTKSKEEEKATIETKNKILKEEDKAKIDNEDKQKKQEEKAKIDVDDKRKEKEKAILEADRKQKEEEKAKNDAEKKQREEKEKAKIDADNKRKEEEERAKIRAEKERKEEDEKAKTDAEKKRKEKEVNAKLDVEKKCKEEEEKARIEAEKKHKEEEEKANIEAEKKRKEEEEQAKLDAEKKRKEEKQKSKLGAEKETKEEEEKAETEAEKKRKEEEEKAKIGAEKKRKEEEERAKLDAEKKRKEEEEKAKLDAEKKRKEEKAKLDAEEKRKDEEEKAKLDAEKKRKEEEERAKLDAEEKRKEEEEKAKIEAEKKRKEEEEKAKLDAEEKRKKEEEKAKIGAEKKRKEEEELAKLDAEKKRKEEEEKAKLDAEKKRKEEKAKLDAEEKRKDEEEKAKLEAEKKRKEEEERAKLDAEKKRKEEEEKAKIDAENKRKEEEEQAKLDAEKKRKEEEQKAKKDAEKKRKEEEEKAKLDAEKKRKEEKEKAKIEAEKKRKEEEEKAKIDAENKRKEEEEQAKLDAEKKRKEEEQKAKIEAEKKRKEEEEKAKLDAEKKRKEEEEKAKIEAEKKRKEEEEKAKIEAEKKRKEEEEKAKLDAEKKRKEEEQNAETEAEKKRKEEEEKAKLDAEKKRKEEEEKAKLDVEKKRKEEEEKAKLVAEKKRKEEEEKAKLDAEKKRKEEEEQAKLDAEKKRKEEEEKAKLDAEMKRKEKEEKAKIDAEKKRKEEEEKAKLDAEKKRKEEEQKSKIEAEKKLKQEEEKAKLDAEKKHKEEEEKTKHDAENKRKEEEEKAKIAAEKKQKEEQEKSKLEAETKRKDQEKKQKKAEKKRKEEDTKLDKDKKLKENKEQEELLETQSEKRDKEKRAADKRLKQEEKERYEMEMKVQKEKEELEQKIKEEERIKEKQIQETKARDEKCKQEKEEKKEREQKRIEKLEKAKEEQKIHEDEEKARLEKKRIAKKKREDEDARLKLEDEKIEKSRKEAAKKRKVEEKLRLAEEQEQLEKREQEMRETERRIREERRRDIEKDLFDTKQKPSTSGLEPLSESRPRNGDIFVKRGTDEDHYIKEYHYEPTKERSQDRSKFVDHNHRDYTMEFIRPSSYREKTFEHERFSERESLGRNATIYKAQTIILDSQLRSSVPPLAERSESERRDRFDRGESERRVDRHRSKALSEARSLISEKRSSVSRDLKRKPVFSTYLTDRTAVEGSRVKLTCSVLSSSDPKITWYRNGILLDNKLKYRTKFIDGLITLEVLNAVVSDSAEYSCTVENENGSVNTSANLKVYPSFEASPIPPTFTRSIRDTYHLAENELVLECRIRGQPLPTITWLKDDKPVSNNERYQAYYLADGVCRLAISSPTPEDSGKYTCKAENSVWSDQITHVVNFTGKESRLSPNIATIERSRFNRQAMESRRPHFTNVLSDYKVAKGGTIGLQVEIRGCPTRVEWLREGRSVTEVYRNARTFVEQGLYTLALSDVTEKESGMYTCRAWSTHGNVDMNAAITVVANEVEGKPAIIAGRPDKDILISVGEDINISFRVQGEPKPKVVFMKGIRDITTSQRVCKMTSDDYVKFTLKRSVVSDAGTYCILARNAYGCDRAFVTVVVRQRASSDNLISDWTYPMDDSAVSVAERKYKSVPDRIPGEPSVVDGGNNWVSLAWPKADPRDTAPVLAYKIESWLLGKEGGARWVELGITPLNSFDAFNLKQGEEYHFRVTPRNRYGWGEAVQTSSPVGIGLAGDRPEFVDILPGQLKVLAGETANLSCSVKGKPLPEIVWMKNGHEIEEESRVTTLYNGQDCSLTIKDICIEDEARYSCEASNVHGRASTYARLAVVTDRLIWEADAKLKRERSQDAEGDYPPQFTMRLRDRRVQATYPVRLTCQVVGNPPPTLTWFKDGELLVFDSRRTNYQDEHFHTLEIAPTTLEDGGVYEAMARNSSGAVSCRCSLVVDKGIRAYVAPEFCCGLEPLYRLSEGEELRISAVVEAYPSVGVTWYRDGVRLRPSRRAIMTLDRDGQIELALAAVTGRDAGVYTCTASNEVGRASTSGKVEVIEGDQPREKRTPPVVINAPDEPYSKEPMFIRKPRSSEAREGDTVIIACEVIGDPKPDVYWLRDFLKPDYYRDATHFKRVGDGPEYRFEIPHAKLDYTGAYSVVAKNVHGEAKAIISLQILAKDPTSSDDSHNVRYGRVDVIPRFERELTDLLSYDGDAVEFECHVSGNPEPDIRWFHYNELIRDCPDFESTFEDGAARLKIKQVTAEDEGTYSCEAANNLGKATSSACLVVYPPGEPNTLSQRLRRPPALLSAASTPRSTPRSTPARSVSRTPGPDPRRLCSPSRQMAPSFYTYPFNKVVEEGDHVTFKCAVKGQPSPWTTWDKDGIIITPSARITMKEKDDMLRILEIEQVSIEDVGIYRITIENEFGRAEATARLEVITQKGKFYGGVRAYSASPRKSLSYRRYPSVPRQD
ncbi:unnamed protein product [Spodoptera exigua]|nr:unnamed protein product [Spodoptera exigua]